MKKIHLGCGSVYLKGYTNVDGKFDNHYLASDRPDIVEKNITTYEKYYKYPVTRLDIEQRNLIKQDVVVDMYAEDYDNLPFEENSLDEILLVQVFEHFSWEEGKTLLNYWYKLLKPGGKIIIDVPDLDRTVDGYYHSRTQYDKDWYARLLFGSQKNKYAFHKGMYNKESLERALKEAKFKHIQQARSLNHFYPAFGLEGIK